MRQNYKQAVWLNQLKTNSKVKNKKNTELNKKSFSMLLKKCTHLATLKCFFFLLKIKHKKFKQSMWT